MLIRQEAKTQGEQELKRDSDLLSLTSLFTANRAGNKIVNNVFQERVSAHGTQQFPESGLPQSPCS